MELIKSKRFVTLVVTVVVLLAVAYAPEFASVETDLITVIGALAGLLIFGYSVEDWALVFKAAENIAAKTPTPLDDQAVAMAKGAAAGVGIKVE